MYKVYYVSLSTAVSSKGWRTVRMYCRIAEMRESEGERRDEFCWVCHKEGSDLIPCTRCVRVFHYRCLLAPSANANASATTPNASAMNPNASATPPNASVTTLNTSAIALNASATSQNVNTSNIDVEPPITTPMLCTECERIEAAQHNDAMRIFTPEHLKRMLHNVVEYLKEQAVRAYLVS
jgi:hypothetical protein